MIVWLLHIESILFLIVNIFLLIFAFPACSKNQFNVCMTIQHDPPNKPFKHK